MSEYSRLFRWGNFNPDVTVNSPFFIDVDGLTESDWNALATLIAFRFENSFGFVEPVSLSALPLVKGLEPFCVSKSNNVLIVDSVYTSSAPFERQRDGRENCVGVAVFAKNPKVSNWIHPIIQFNSFFNIRWK